MHLFRKMTASLLAVMIVCALFPVHVSAAMPEDMIESQYPTVRAYLTKFCDTTGNAFCQPSEDGFIYVAGDSAWMSAEEWKSLTSDLDRTIMPEEVDLIKTRYVEMQKNLYDFGRDKTCEGFTNVIETFCPELLPVLDGREDAVSYWLNTIALGIFCMGDLQSFLHEIQHEGSAVRSGCFESRGTSTSSIYVKWSGRPSVFWYYDCVTREWVSVKSIGMIPYTASLMKNYVPDDVKNTPIYNNYHLKENAAANEWGIYGILTEFASTVVEARAAAICVSAGRSGYAIKKTTTMPYVIVSQHYFWRANTLGYLAALRERSPQQYESLISNRQLVSLILHLIDFGEQQMQYEDIEDMVEQKVEEYSGYYISIYPQIKSLIDWSKSYDEELDGLRTIYDELISRDGYILCCENCVHPHE